MAKKSLVLEHVLFEIEMYLLAIIESTEKDIPERIKQFWANLLWEAELNHLRNLLYFFASSKKYPTDIHCLDIVKTPIVIKTDLIAKINKTTSHLTYEGKEQDWEISVREKIYYARNSMFKVIKNFIKKLKTQTDVKPNFFIELNNVDIIQLISCIEKMLNALTKK